MSLKVYLAGYIQGEVIEECTSWRKRIREFYDNWKGTGKRYPICWLDPLNGEDFAEISPDGLKGVMPPNAIVHKDYTCVEKCDLIVVNMDTFGTIQRGVCVGCAATLSIQRLWDTVVTMEDYNSVYTGRELTRASIDRVKRAKKLRIQVKTLGHMERVFDSLRMGLLYELGEIYRLDQEDFR